MPGFSVRITTPTRKELEQTVRRAFQAGDLPVVKRVTALLAIARGEPVERAAGGVGVSASSVYAWLRAFLLAGVDGLRVRWRGGGPAKLTAAQRQRLGGVVWAGPGAGRLPSPSGSGRSSRPARRRPPSRPAAGMRC